MLELCNKREIAKLARTCINALGWPKPGPLQKPLIAWASQGASTAILGSEGVKAFKELIRNSQGCSVDGKPLRGLYALKTLQRKAKGLISDIARRHGRWATANQVRCAVEDWMATFHRDFPPISYYVPIVNLKVGSPLSIGRVTFHPLTPKFRQKLLESYVSIFDEAEMSHRLKENLRREAASLFRSQECHAAAEVSLTVDEASGDELCVGYTEQALNVLRYYGYLLYSPSERAYVAVRGRLAKGHLGFLRLVPGERCGTSRELTGPGVAYDLSGQNIDRLRAWGLDMVSTLLKPNRLNEVEDALLSALEWSGRASQSLEAEGRFVNLWIAVETLLTCDDDKKRDETQGQLIAHRASSILAVGQKERERLKNLWNEKLYRVRCDLVHRGSSEELRAYLPWLEFYGPRIIMSCIDNLKAGNSWPTKTGFISWLEGSR